MDNSTPHRAGDDPHEAGVRLFNAHAFFAAHEALEDAWRAATGDEKRFLQALTQLAVALHHFSTGNRAGARSVLDRATRTLQAYPAAYLAIDVARLRGELAAWQAHLAGDAPQPPFPRL
jgi:uncharacterized protein